MAVIYCAFPYRGDQPDYLTNVNQGNPGNGVALTWAASFSDTTLNSVDPYFNVMKFNTTDDNGVTAAQIGTGSSNASNTWAFDCGGMSNPPRNRFSNTDFVGTGWTVWTYTGNTVSKNLGGTIGTQTIYIFNSPVDYSNSVNNAWCYPNNDDYVHYDNSIDIGRQYNNTSTSNVKAIDVPGYKINSTTLGTQIIELVHNGNSSGSSGLGIYSTSTNQNNISAQTALQNVSIYSYKDGAPNVKAIAQYTRKVYAIHNLAKSASDNDVNVAYFGTKSGSGSESGYYAYTAPSNLNEWCLYSPPTDSYGAERRYYAITVSDTTVTSTWFYTSGKMYTIKLHTYSELNWDGILIYKNVTSPSPGTSGQITAISDSNIMMRCHGLNVSQQQIFAASDMGTTLCVCFRTDGSGISSPISGGCSYGNVEIIGRTPVSVTLSKNGGTGGTSSVTIGAGAETDEYPSISLPTRSATNSGGPAFGFTGYFDNLVNGNQYYDNAGSPKRVFDKTSSTTFYAHWYNTINYVAQSSVSVVTSSSTQNVTVATTSTCSSGSTMTYSVGLWNGSTAVSGATISSDGKTVTLPGGLAVGTYDIEIDVTSPSNTGTNGYTGGTDTFHVPLTVTEPTTITITLKKNGGSGSDTNITVTPGAAAGSWSVGTLPTRTGFSFKGYYTGQLGGTQYTNSSGITIASAPNVSILYANWINKITYNPNTGGITVYCTTSASPATSAVGNIAVSIATTNATCGSGTVTFQEATYEWTISNSGKTVTIPSGTGYGSYILDVGAFSPSGSNYFGDSVGVDVPITLASNVLLTSKYKNTSGTLGSNFVPGTPTVNIVSTSLRANGGYIGVSCSCSDNQYTWYQKYSNGTYTPLQTSSISASALYQMTSNGNNRYTIDSGIGGGAHPQTLSGVTGSVYSGTTYYDHSNMTTNVGTDTIVITAYNILSVGTTGTGSASISNNLESISINGATTTINLNASTSASVMASYTSGSTEDVTDSLSITATSGSNRINSGNTNIITISNI